MLPLALFSASIAIVKCCSIEILHDIMFSDNPLPANTFEILEREFPSKPSQGPFGAFDSGLLHPIIQKAKKFDQHEIIGDFMRSLDDSAKMALFTDASLGGRMEIVDYMIPFVSNSTNSSSIYKFSFASAFHSDDPALLESEAAMRYVLPNLQPKNMAETLSRFFQSSLEQGKKNIARYIMKSFSRLPAELQASLLGMNPEFSLGLTLMETTKFFLLFKLIDWNEFPIPEEIWLNIIEKIALITLRTHLIGQACSS